METITTMIVEIFFIMILLFGMNFVCPLLYGYFGIQQILICEFFSIINVNDISPKGDMIYGLRRMIYLPCGKYDIISVPSYAAGVYHRT